jgi:hypothetical protein
MSDFLVILAGLGSLCQGQAHNDQGRSEAPVKKLVVSVKLLRPLLLSCYATDSRFVFLSFRDVFHVLYRVFSSFHQHNFVSLSLSLWAEVTGFVIEKTDGVGGGGALIRTLYARNNQKFHLPGFLSLLLSFLFISFRFHLVLFIFPQFCTLISLLFATNSCLRTDVT